MFRIESYITSIILANADRYIKNFRKQDAQVSLWEGDATFHNIDLNVEALNEELQSSFTFTSGYIHDLIIHVPWTKLMSEPVTISVNTIELVMRLKTKDDWNARPQDRTTNFESKESHEKRSNDEISNQASYTSALTSKIMNNLSIRCENVILKLVEEDIVFSMNIEKLTFDNVNENWTPAMTDVSMEKSLARKLITLSGVTICLDKQNSSGRIDTYLDPLLYRCQIYIRLMKAYNNKFSRKPVCTRFDILSEKMSFTVSEPQIPMLLKLGILIFRSNDNSSTAHSRSLSFNSDTMSSKSESSHLYDENATENTDMTSWGNWLWSMVPSILPQDDDNPVENIDANTNCTFHIGFCVKTLETNLKILHRRVKKSSKIEYQHFFKSTFQGCIYRMVMRNSEWFNVQFGVNYVSVELPFQQNNSLPKNQFIIAGVDSDSNILKDTLFDEKGFHSKIQRQLDDSEQNSEFVQNNIDFELLDSNEMSIDSHLNLYTEHALLEKTQAFAIDYLKTYQKSKANLTKENELIEVTHYSDTESVDEFVAESKLDRIEKHILLRLVHGPATIRITSDVIDSLRYIHKIIQYNEYSTFQQNSTSGGMESENYSRNRYSPNYVTQMTFFDLSFEFLPTYRLNRAPNCETKEFVEASVTVPSPVLNLFCKCIDGKISKVRNITSDGREEFQTVTSFKAVEITSSLVKLGQKTLLSKCEKFDWEMTHYNDDSSRKLRIETKNFSFVSSKPNLLLGYYITNYIWSSFFQSERRMNYYTKIFHSSLIEDSYLTDNVGLEIFVDSITLKINIIKDVSKMDILVNNCKAYANKLDHNVQKRIIVFNAADTSTESSRINVAIQWCKNCNEKCDYPSIVWFNVCNLKVNLDVMIYSWVMYEAIPTVRDNLTKAKSEQSVSRSANSRKISDANSGHGRRYSTNIPKPKESVHSSSEHEILSPPVATDTETSDIFQLPVFNDVDKSETSIMEYLKNNIRLWRSLVIYGEISQVTVYIPTGEFTNEKTENIEYLIKESFKNKDHMLGVFLVTIKSAKIKCDVPLNILEELSSDNLITFSEIGWSAEKLTFPWTICLTEIDVSTILDNTCKPLLKPLSANCTVGISIKDGNENESIIALCVHSDFQPIVVILTNKQVNLIIETIAVLKRHIKRREVPLLKEHSKLTNIRSEMKTDQQNKFTGWIQCTFTKCSIIVLSKQNAELKKLSIEFEDSIMSLEFDDVFHKMKLKIASFGIDHYTRKSKNDCWQTGPFRGVIIQRSYSQPLNDKKNDEDGDGRFLLVTVTRARSNNLKTRVLPGQISDALIKCEKFVTEIILKICSVDVILPFCVLETFVSVLVPLKELFHSGLVSNSSIEKEKTQISFTTLPLVYFDIPKIRIFIPLSSNAKNETNNLNDTVLCEIGSIHFDCHPENPIIRKPLHPELYYAISGKTSSGIEHKLLNQQYQLIISDISANTGIWYEIQSMLEKEHLSVEEPPSAFEQNPAVMWNQGCHPDSKHKINLRHLSPILSKFTCEMLIAPPVESTSLKTVLHSAHYEIAVLSDINVTVSLHQVVLLTLLGKEFSNSVLPYFEPCKDYINVNFTENAKTKVIDSGIESMDQSSVESSSVAKNKTSQSINSKIFYSASSNASGMHQHSGFLMRYENVKEIYIATQNINFIFFKSCEIKENDEKRIVYDPLFCAEIMQPYLLLRYENQFSYSQFSIFHVTVKFPTISSTKSYFARTPSVKDFSRILLYTKKTNCDSYTKIKYPCFIFNSSSDSNKRYKNEVILSQPLLIDCDVSVIKRILSTIESYTTEFHNLVEIFEQIQKKRDQSIQTIGKGVKFVDKYHKYFPLISNCSLTTNRILLVFKSTNKGRNLLFNLNGIDVKTKTPTVMKNLSESISLQCCFKCISILLPQSTDLPLSEILVDEPERSNDLLSNMMLKPWNVNLEIFAIFQRWNLFHQTPWICFKIYSENIILEINPSYLDFVTNLVSEYRKVYEMYKSQEEIILEEKKTENPSESYKDDLRAGAFQYIKHEFDKYELPAPYEVVFCNRPVQPYMCWRYPQPRCLTRLQIYPVPVEDVNEDYLEEEIRCQLQYYDELRGTFLPHVSFSLSENSIQNVDLPEKPYTNAAECWRIVLYDMADSKDNMNSLKIDVRSLAGCVRVDSTFLPSEIPERQFLIDISEIQVNFSTLLSSDCFEIDNYRVTRTPTQQHFISVICDDLKTFIFAYNDSKENTIELSAIFKANILNYEYLMFQSFIDPVFVECTLYFAENTIPKLTALIRDIRIRVSPNFIHTLSISKELWNDWESNSSQWKVTPHYIICNNTNHAIEIQQENSSQEIVLEKFHCHLYAWHDPSLPKRIQVSKKKYFQNALSPCASFQIKKPGYYSLICEDKNKSEISHMFVSVIKHSAVVNQVIIYGNLLIYNLTSSVMGIEVVSHGKRDAKFSSTQIVIETSIMRNRLESLIVPDSHKLSFRVCYGFSFLANRARYSGLIPLVTFQQSSNQNSYLVKVPWRNRKEQFQSIWCQVTREIVNNCAKYLVVFRPLCSVISFLPWKSHVQVFDDVGTAVSSDQLNDKGKSTELFIPNTVTLDKYTVEWKPTQEHETCSTKIHVKKLPKQKHHDREWSIHCLIDEISRDMEDGKWPFLNIDCSRFTWKTDTIYNITPNVNIIRKEDTSCGTKIEIYPWAIIVNMLNFRVLLDISDTIYTIESYEIIAPPCIETTFKLGIVDGKDYLSGVLQLSDNQSFPIPKVTGRIPMDGFVTTMIECDTYVTFVNITSRNYKQMRVISMCSSYVITNNTDVNINCAALVVCRTANCSSASFDIPYNLQTMSVDLPSKQDTQLAQPITKWYKIGEGDVQVLPYLILSVKGNAACPIRICDLSEKQRYSIIFSNTSNETPPCIFMTAQQDRGQVFLTIWNEKIPQIVVHNMSQLSLNINSSKSDRASAEVLQCPDWNWKFSIIANSTGYFHIPQQLAESKKKPLHFLKFAVKNTKHVKETKWSCGVALKPCVNQLITLPLSQHHIKLAIFKNGFTHVVWIESATSDELSAKMIRTRLSESFLPINSGGIPPVSEIYTSHTEDSNEIPQKVANFYSRTAAKPYDLNILVEKISFTVACDDEITGIEKDISTFTMEAVKVNLSTVQKPNEVKEDICCTVDVACYRVDNDQFQENPFDFPIVLLSKSPNNEPIMHYNIRDLLLANKRDDFSAMKITVALNSENVLFDIRDLDLTLISQDVFLEDRYLLLLKIVLENLFSSTYDSSILQIKPVDKSKDLVEIDSKQSDLELKKTGIEENTGVKESSSSKSVNISENTDNKSCNSIITVDSNIQNDENMQYVVTADVDEMEGEIVTRNQLHEAANCIIVPAGVVALSHRIAKPLRLRNFRISSFCATVSLHTSTAFYIALDRSPLNFSEFKKDYLITTPFELGNLLTVHYFFGAVYGTGWAISSLEFVGSPGGLARTVGTGIKDFVSMPIYGIASGPRGFVLGVAHGSASLMKHVMAGTLSSVTKFAGSWARTLDRFTLDPEDLLQSEEIRRFPPNSIAEGVLQGLTEFGISILGGISGIAHHPLQYAVSNGGNRSLINSISLGIVGVLTRPISGAAALVSKTGQGILSHVGWNAVPMVRSEPIQDKNFSHLQLSSLKCRWDESNDMNRNVVLAVEAVNAQNVTIPLWISLTSKELNIVETTNSRKKFTFDLRTHEFRGCEFDPTLIVILKPVLNLKDAEDFIKARIMKFINETNHCYNIENTYMNENTLCSSGAETVSSFYVNPRVRNFLLCMISFVKNMPE